MPTFSVPAPCRYRLPSVDPSRGLHFDAIPGNRDSVDEHVVASVGKRGIGAGTTARLPQFMRLRSGSPRLPWVLPILRHLVRIRNPRLLDLVSRLPALSLAIGDRLPAVFPPVASPPRAPTRQDLSYWLQQ
jgi:hypothetical protein